MNSCPWLTLIELTKRYIKDLPYKKIIVWCGMISLCNELAEEWKNKFENFLIATDTSEENNNFKTFDDFNKAECNAILFCAGKHREGSDLHRRPVLHECVLAQKRAVTLEQDAERTRCEPHGTEGSCSSVPLHVFSPPASSDRQAMPRVRRVACGRKNGVVPSARRATTYQPRAQLRGISRGATPWERQHER